eukprot:SAG11_NODE_2026_length_3907_cov_14.338498_3_plen_65_part_00
MPWEEKQQLPVHCKSTKFKDIFSNLPKVSGTLTGSRQNGEVDPIQGKEEVPVDQARPAAARGAR